MMSFVDVVRSSNKKRALFFEVACVAGASLVLALCAQISFYLWFTPIPITLQSLGVLLIGATLGSKRGALAVILYLIEGASGLPFFAGGHGGMAVLFGPTGGYLLSFILTAYAAGFFLERGWKKHYGFTVLALTIASLINLGCGALWLGSFVGMDHALAHGVYPFLVGGLLKVLIATSLVRLKWTSTRFL